MSRGTVNFASQFAAPSAFSRDLHVNLCFLFFPYVILFPYTDHNFIFIQSSTYLTTFFAPVALVTASSPSSWSSLNVIDCLSYTLSFCSPGLHVAGIITRIMAVRCCHC